jgi:hypothetical protein
MSRDKNSLSLYLHVFHRGNFNLPVMLCVGGKWGLNKYFSKLSCVFELNGTLIWLVLGVIR